MKAKLHFEARFLIRPSLRRYLDNCKYNNYIDDWKESKGLIESDFYLFGEEKYLKMIKKDLEEQTKG